MCYSMQGMQSERDFKGGENVSQQYQDGFGKKDVEESEGKSRVEKDGS